jgi:hypothetical protein
MKSIFRKSRFDSFLMGKIKNYLFYALGEILLVMLGILLALYVSNWNEERKNKQEEEQILTRIVKDLEQDLISFNRDYTKKNEYLNNCLSGQYQSIEYDSLAKYLNNYFAFFKTNASYIGLKDGGRLSLIKDETLKTKLITYYERQYDILLAFAAYHKSYHNEQIIPVLLSVPRDEERIIELDVTNLEIKKLFRVIEYQIDVNEFIIQHLEASRNAAKEIIEQISQ